MVEPLNALRLVAVLAQRGIVRYTPAGVPMLDATVQHRSRQTQPGVVTGGQPPGPRAVDFELAVVFPGGLATRASALAVGTTLDLSGYLASRRQASRALVLHVTDFAPIAGGDGESVDAAPVH